VMFFSETQCSSFSRLFCDFDASCQFGTVCYALSYLIVLLVWENRSRQCKVVHYETCNIFIDTTRGTRHSQNSLATVFADYVLRSTPVSHQRCARHRIVANTTDASVKTGSAAITPIDAHGWRIIVHVECVEYIVITLYYKKYRLPSSIYNCV